MISSSMVAATLRMPASARLSSRARSAESLRRAEDVAAVAEQSLAFAGQHQPPTHAIEQPDSELIFEIPDLAGQRGLRDPQAQRRFRDGPLPRRP